MVCFMIIEISYLVVGLFHDLLQFPSSICDTKFLCASMCLGPGIKQKGPNFPQCMAPGYLA